MMSGALNLETTAELSSGMSLFSHFLGYANLSVTGFTLPLLGLGVYENDDCVPACLAALKHGYRCVSMDQ